MSSSNSWVYGLSVLAAGIIGYASIYAANNIFPITGGSVSKPEPQPEPQPEPKPEPKPEPQPEPEVSATAPQIESIPEEQDFAGGGGSETVEDSSDEEELLESPEITTTANTWINPHSSGGFSFPSSLNNTTPIGYNQPLTNGLTYHF